MKILLIYPPQSSEAFLPENFEPLALEILASTVKHPNLFNNWKDIGLDNLTIGFEAVENNKLKELNKANRIEINQQAVQILNDLHINFSSYFLIDPDFEKEDFQNILNYIDRLNLIRPRFVILTPLPGTELYELKKIKLI